MREKKIISSIPELILAYFRRIADILGSIHYDAIFIHRELTPAGPPVYEWLMTRLIGKKIIYDFDDAIWLTDDTTRNGLLKAGKWTGKIASICRWSYRVSCGNEYLRSFALKHNPESRLNPTTIDMIALGGKCHLHQPGQIMIGWTGSHTTLKYLYLISEALGKVLKHPDINLTVICNQRPEWEIHDYKFIEWKKETEIDDLLGIDIGLMPLPDDQWTRGKCGFKALQYLALGIPALVSPLDANRQIVDHGINGFYCSTEGDWINFITELFNDHRKRDAFGKNGIQKIIAHFSTGSNLRNFLGFFE